MTALNLLPDSVATREGGVDRNLGVGVISQKGLASPPARVAWIETRPGQRHTRGGVVATREGGVDRNFINEVRPARAARRHPRGWRG